MSDDDLDRRIGRLEDLHAIRQLSARYALAIDNRDYPALTEMFAADATFGGTSDGAASLTGKDAIVAALCVRLDAAGATFHSVHDVLVTLDPDNRDVARATVTAHAETRTGSSLVVKPVHYSDDYRRIAGRWCFQRRLLEFPFDAAVLASDH